MRIQNARQEIRNTLSFFSESFSRPSFKIFSCFIIGFIQLGKEVHTSSMVQSLAHSFLHRSLSSFTRFLGQNLWAMEELTQSALDQFFQTLRIRVRDVVFLIVDDTLVQKTGKKIPGCGWHKDHAQNMANVFGHQWVLSALLHKDFLLPLWAKLYHPKGVRGGGPFETKIALAQKIIRALVLPIPCKLYVLADSWYWAKTLANACRRCGYHMISQLKSNSVLWIDEKKTSVKSLLNLTSSYREVSLFVYGRTKTLRIARFMGDIKGLGKVAVVVVKEKRKKPTYLVCTNIHLAAIDIIKYYAKRWKIEQMIKDLKQRLGFGDYQVRDLQAIERHVALVLLSYFVLILLKILQWLKDKKRCLDLSIRRLAFQVRNNILLENISVTLNAMRIRFKQSILDTYLGQLWA
ncbi:MAG: transposase [Chloroflexi bacterium]|nr:transposase [Chloroflexota bacterium]MBM4277119.1 transposase [Deltaproteobacteria bacterium]